MFRLHTSMINIVSSGNTSGWFGARFSTIARFVPSLRTPSGVTVKSSIPVVVKLEIVATIEAGSRMVLFALAVSGMVTSSI